MVMDNPESVQISIQDLPEIHQESSKVQEDGIKDEHEQEMPELIRPVPRLIFASPSNLPYHQTTEQPKQQEGVGGTASSSGHRSHPDSSSSGSTSLLAPPFRNYLFPHHQQAVNSAFNSPISTTHYPLGMATAAASTGGTSLMEMLMNFQQIHAATAVNNAGVPPQAAGMPSFPTINPMLAVLAAAAKNNIAHQLSTPRMAPRTGNANGVDTFSTNSTPQFTGFSPLSSNAAMPQTSTPKTVKSETMNDTSTTIATPCGSEPEQKSNKEEKPKKRTRLGGSSVKTAEVWRFFTELPAPEQAAACMICGKTIKATNSSTTGMIRHLRSCHSKEYDVLQQARRTSYLVKTLKNDDSIREQLLKELVSGENSSNEPSSIKFPESLSNKPPPKTPVSAERNATTPKMHSVEAIMGQAKSETPNTTPASVPNAQPISLPFSPSLENLFAHLKRATELGRQQLSQQKSLKRQAVDDASMPENLILSPKKHETIKKDENSEPFAEESNGQQTIAKKSRKSPTSSFQRSNSAPIASEVEKREADKLTKQIAVMLIMDGPDPSILDRMGFRNLLRHLAPKYEMPSAKEFAEKIIPAVWKELEVSDKNALIRRHQENNYYSDHGSGSGSSTSEGRKSSERTSPGTFESGFHDDEDGQNTATDLSIKAEPRESLESVVQNSIQAQNISQSFSYSISLGNGHHHHHKDLDDSDTSSSVDSDTMFAAKLEAFFEFIGRADNKLELQNSAEQNALHSLIAQCYNIVAQFEETPMLRDHLVQHSGQQSYFSNEALFGDEFEGDEIPHLARCVTFVDKHYDLIHGIGQHMPISQFTGFSEGQRFTLKNIVEQIRGTLENSTRTE